MMIRGRWMGIAAVLMIVGCGGSKETLRDSSAVGMAARTILDDPSAVIGLERGSVLGVHVYMPPDSVKQLLGDPLREGSDLSDSIPVTVLEYPMGTIRLRPVRGVVEFLCGGDDCQTADSVGI